MALVKLALIIKLVNIWGMPMRLIDMESITPFCTTRRT